MKQNNTFYLQEATRQAGKSGCRRGKRGAVFVRNNKLLVKAHNQIYPTNDFCQKHGCLRDKLKLGLGENLEKCRSIHAEAMGISLAAQKGICLKESTAYITSMPCINCAKLLLASEIKEVYYLDVYGDRAGESFLKKMGVKCQRVKLLGDDPKKRLRDAKGQ